MRTSRSATARCRIITTVWERFSTCLRMVQITSRFPGAPARKDKPRITHDTTVPPSNSEGAISSWEDSWYVLFMVQVDVLTVVSAWKEKQITLSHHFPFKAVWKAQEKSFLTGLFKQRWLMHVPEVHNFRLQFSLKKNVEMCLSNTFKQTDMILICKWMNN